MSEFDTLADLVEVTEKLIPFNRILGVRDCRIDDDGVARIRVDQREDLVGNFARGFLHGGVVAATLDVAGGIAAMMAVVGRTPPTTRDEAGRIFSNISTIDMRIDYLRPALASGSTPPPRSCAVVTGWSSRGWSSTTTRARWSRSAPERTWSGDPSLGLIVSVA